MPDTRRSPGDQPFSIERRGTELVPPGERHGRPLDVFWMWLGTNFNVGYVVFGAIIVLLGLSFTQAVAIILIGNLSFFAVGLTSIQGPRTGTTTFVMSRAAFGTGGNRVPSLFNWITLVGFEASNIALIVLAGDALLAQAGLRAGAGVKIAVLVAALAIQLLLPLLGHATIVLVQRVLCFVFIPIYAVMAALIIPKVHLGSLAHGGSWGLLMAGLALVISGGGLSWSNCGSDYTRYLPASTPARSLWWWSSIGGFVSATVLEVLGAAVASVVTNASDPISGLPSALPAGLLIPYLVFAIVTLFAVNTLDLYSSGLSLQAVVRRISRVNAVLVDLVVSGVLAGITVFSAKFNTYFADFLGLLILWLAPWFGIYMTDWLLRRQYDVGGLFAARGGPYWYRGGVHVPGLVALAAGMAAAAMWINSAVFAGPLSSVTDHSDFSVFTGIGVGGLTYYLATRRSARAAVSAPAADVRAVEA
jgi:purine-cytosine permease-like protein